MNNPHNLQVGQKIFVVPTNYNRGEPYEAVISKVGRKWATYKRYGRDCRVDLISLCVDGGQHSSPATCYLSETCYRQKQEKIKYWNAVVRGLPYTTPSCNIDDLKKVVEILGIDVNDQR